MSKHGKMLFKSVNKDRTIQDTDSDIVIPKDEYKRITLSEDVISSIRGGELHNLMDQDKVKYKLQT